MRKINGSAIGVLALFSAQHAVAEERVTVDNFPRVETDYYFKTRKDAGCFGKLCNERGPKPEPPRVCRRPFRLSHAAMADSRICA
jgi:hypothetical protein